MSKKIYIFDTTLRDGEQSPGVSLNVQEKLEIARQLERLGVDVIEAGFPAASKGDFKAVKAVAEEIKGPVIVGLARAYKADIDRAWEALKHAEKPRIHTFIATSELHMKYKLKMEPEQVLKQAAEMVAYAKSLCKDVEFSPEDGTRTDVDFLYKVLETVIDAGANVVNIPDTVGYTTPGEFGALIAGIRKNVPNIDRAVISVHCHNDLGMAVANSLAAVENGAQQVECTINGLGERAGNAALEEIVMALKTRFDYYGTECNIETTQISHTSSLVSHLTGIDIQSNKAITGANAFAHESGIHQHGVLNNPETYEIMKPESIGLKQSQLVLGKHSGRHAFEEKLKELGYINIGTEKLKEVFDKFKTLADRKKYIMDKDIQTLMSQEALHTPEAYDLEHFHISSANDHTSTSTVKIRMKEKVVEEAACGNGPVNATFNAIERATGVEVTLKDYSLKAVTSGKDALGKATVRVEKDSKVYVGSGISTDVIEASARAYLNAINNMVCEMD